MMFFDELACAHGSWDNLRIHCGPDPDKDITQNE